MKAIILRTITLTPPAWDEVPDIMRRLRLLAARGDELRAEAAIAAGDLGEPMSSDEVRRSLRSMRRVAEWSYLRHPSNRGEL